MGDGKTSDAEKIQKVIELYYEQRGGVVLLDSGHVFVSGSLILKENVELHIERGAVLKASENLEDYALIDEAAKLTENQDSIFCMQEMQIISVSAVAEKLMARKKSIMENAEKIRLMELFI